MTDTEYEELKARIRTAFEKWNRPCGLGWWRDITLEYYRDLSGWVRYFNEPYVTQSDMLVRARTTCDWRYRHGMIHFNCEGLVEIPDAELDYIIRHEICHLLVHQMREWQHGNNERSLDHEEACVTNLAMVLEWVREAGRDDSPAKTLQSRKR